MTNGPKSADESARDAWGMAQRVGMYIAGLPLDKRDAALAVAENSLREAGQETGISGEQMDAFIELQMNAIRQIVRDIDVSGSPQSGRA